MATSRILSVTIEKYSDPAWDLPGVTNDGDRMFALFRDLYTVGSYKRLADKDATRLNIEEGIIELLQGTAAGETAIFYYSGHGTRLPIKKTTDPAEEDLKDDALVPYDNSTGSLIIDNWIGATVAMYLKKEARLFFIVDACHSGTILKEADKEVYVRSKEVLFRRLRQDTPPILVEHSAKLATRAQSTQIDDLPVAQLAAAKEKQIAIATELPGGVNGSTFTYALTKVLKSAPQGATWSALQADIAAEVAELTDVHQPEFVFYGDAGTFPAVS